MKREIKFRGKRAGYDEWACGSLEITHDSKAFIWVPIAPLGIVTQVIPETVGQYTGEKCKGVDIFEGDILAPDSRCQTERYIVSWNKEHCCFVCIREGSEIGDDGIQYHLISNMRLEMLEIVGNIHDSGTPA